MLRRSGRQVLRTDTPLSYASMLVVRRQESLPSARGQKIRCLMPFSCLLGFVLAVLRVFGRFLNLDAVVEITGNTAQYPMHHTHGEQHFFLRSRKVSAQNVYDGNQAASNSDIEPPQHPSTDLKVDKHTSLLTRFACAQPSTNNFRRISPLLAHIIRQVPLR